MRAQADTVEMEAARPTFVFISYATPIGSRTYKCSNARLRSIGIQLEGGQFEKFIRPPIFFFQFNIFTHLAIYQITKLIGFA